MTSSISVTTDSIMASRFASCLSNSFLRCALLTLTRFSRTPSTPSSRERSSSRELICVKECVLSEANRVAFDLSHINTGFFEFLLQESHLDLLRVLAAFVVITSVLEKRHRPFECVTHRNEL